ncbi:adenosine deaminase/editase [Microdochium trichocladiopsis]|uniref:Adenosine deaminase/editase n=1 Tax=Microdochium trichocladiopsis TaxID=1682393 RepID=A0A9P8YDZ9_9PEZI|nr:adenosine deaminase/editase [Microdochium trichocladiopsis]KAH7037132.1 adenosine deaminase/editase [Microdochium trichocladiopsis]
MTVDPERIAHLVQQEFQKLPAKRRPAVRGNGLHEWVPLSGIVAQASDGELYCLSVATGMKCLPSSKLPLARGNVIHDWHAEVLAIRAFNRFVLDECKRLASEPDPSSLFLCRRAKSMVAADTDCGDNDAVLKQTWHAQPFTWREDMTLHMYCSEAPCGDASMELTMAAQEDASPWELPAASTSADTPHPGDSTCDDNDDHGLLLGRGFFSQLGVVRRKPSRGDAPPTLSKSCSDKLSLKQCTSLLSSISSLLVDPEHVYLSTIIMPESQFSESGCARAFSADSEQAGRMAPLLYSSLSLVSGSATSSSRRGGYHFRTFQVLTVPADSAAAGEFHYSKWSVTARAAAAAADTPTAPKIAASNLAVAWTRSGLEEGTLGGVLQGRKQFDARGASFTSRKRMWSLAAEIADILLDSESTAGDASGEQPSAAQELRAVLQGSRSYDEVKQSPMLAARRSAKDVAKKDALKGWVRNSGDEEFDLA